MQVTDIGHSDYRKNFLGPFVQVSNNCSGNYHMWTGKSFFSGQNIVYNNVMLNSVLDLRPGKKKVSTFYHMFFSNISKYFSPVTYRLRRFFIFSVLVVAE